MNSSIRTCLRGAGAALVLVLALSACAGDDAPEPAAPSGSSSSDSGDSGQSGEAAEGGSVAGAELGQRMLDAMTEAQTASFTGETTAAGASTTTEGVVRIEPESTATRATTQAQGQTIEIILLPDGAFLSTGDTGDGKPWLRIDAGSSDPAAAAMGQFLDSFKAASDPRSSAEVYRQAGDFTVVGTEDVGGVEATHYSGAIPPAALLSALPEEMRAGMEPMLGTEPFPVEIWLDGDDRPVRFVQTATIQGAETTSTQTFSGWGDPVEIEAPPAEQIQG